MHRFFLGDPGDGGPGRPQWSPLHHALPGGEPGRPQGSPLHHALPGTKITLPEKLAHQIRDVLHLVIGEQLVLLDNSGDEFLCSVTKSSKASVEVEITERRAGRSESSVRVILCQGLLKSARFEWILEKGTELGAAAFAPIVCHRSMSGLDDAGTSKLQRWQRILQEAAEQCGRSRLPALLPIRPLAQALHDIPSGAIALMPWEEEHGQSLRAALQQHVGTPTRGVPPGVLPGVPPGVLPGVPPDIPPGVPPDIPPAHLYPLTVVLFIGPEGGLTAEEVQLAQRHGVQIVTLGQRILRAETAALATVANVMYELETLHPSW